jgi:hypothetical protein
MSCPCSRTADRVPDSWRNRWTTWKDKRPRTTAGRQRSTISAPSIGDREPYPSPRNSVGTTRGGTPAEPPARPHRRSWPAPRGSLLHHSGRSPPGQFVGPPCPRRTFDGVAAGPVGEHSQDVQGAGGSAESGAAGMCAAAELPTATTVEQPAQAGSGVSGAADQLQDVGRGRGEGLIDAGGVVAQTCVGQCVVAQGSVRCVRWNRHAPKPRSAALRIWRGTRGVCSLVTTLGLQVVWTTRDRVGRGRCRAGWAAPSRRRGRLHPAAAGAANCRRPGAGARSGRSPG